MNKKIFAFATIFIISLFMMHLVTYTAQSANAITLQKPDSPRLSSQISIPEIASAVHGQVLPKGDIHLVQLIGNDSQILAETLVSEQGYFHFNPLAHPQPAVFRTVTLDKEELLLTELVEYIPGRESIPYVLNLALTDDGQPQSSLIFPNNQTSLKRSTQEEAPESASPDRSLLTSVSGGILNGVITYGDTELPASARISIYTDTANTTPFMSTYIAPETNGYYSFTGLAPNNYYIMVDTAFGNQNNPYLIYYHGGQPTLASSTPISIVSNETVELDISVIRGATIQGKITAESSTIPTRTIQGYVNVRNPDTGVTVKFDSTVEDSYSISGLNTGTYLLSYDWKESDGSYSLLPGYYEGSIGIYLATPISITAGTTTTQDLTVRVGGDLSITVITTDTKELIPAYIQLSRWKGDCGGWEFVKSTNQTTWYTPAILNSLDTGQYRIEVRASNDPGYATYVSDIINITAGQPHSYQAILETGGQITGQIVDEDTHQPLSNVRINAYQVTADGKSIYTTKTTGTDSAGQFTLSGLDGDYYLAINEWFSSDTNSQYVAKLYDTNSNYAMRVEEATLITVTTGETVAISDALTIGAQVSGFITKDTDGGGLSGITVSVLPLNGSTSDVGGVGRAFSYSSVAGQYTTTAVLPGDEYYVTFSDIHDYEYRTEYYSDTIDLDEAYHFNLSQGQTLTNINASLSLDITTIRGSIIYDFPRSSSWSYVRIYNMLGEEVTSGWSTWAYRAVNLPYGTYKVLFESADILSGTQCYTYHGQYYGGASTFANATPITISEQAPIMDSINGILSQKNSPPRYPHEGLYSVYVPLVSR